MKRALVMVGVMVFSSPALADPNPTLGGRWGYDRGDYYGRSYNETSRVQAGILQGALQDRAQTGAQWRVQRSDEVQGLPLMPVEAASVRRPHLFQIITRVPKTRTSGEVCCRAAELYLPLIRRNPRKALDRSKVSARNPYRKALAHNLDRSAGARNLDLAFRTRDTHHAGGATSL
jgi:hypothetical protein